MMAGHALRCTVWMLAAALGVFAAPTAVAAQNTPGSRVLVMPFTAEVDPDAPGGGGAALWLGEAASTLIVEGLSTRGVGAMSRDERVAAFARLNIPMTAALTRATTIRIGELIGASEIVFGEVRLGRRMQVRARLVRLSTGDELDAVDHEGNLGDIFSVFGTVSERLSSQTGRLRPVRPAPLPLALETFESYVKGLVAATPAAQQRFLEAAVRQAPGDPRILMALWEVYAAQGMHDRAVASANAVPVEAAAYRQARFAVALSMLELRRFDGAAQALTVMYATSRTAAVSSLLGIVHLRRGAAPGAEAPAVFFRRAVDEDPENTDYLFNLGYAHALSGNTADAITWLREVVRFDAADGDAHLVMSVVLASMGRTTEAQRERDLARLLGGVDDATPAPGAGPRLPPGLERLPQLADLASTSPPRVVIANRAQRDQQETARFHLTNARAFIGSHRDRDAIGELRRAIYLAPYEEEPHRLLGGIHQRAGRLVEALEEFTVALWCLETVAGRVALGQALLESGQGEAARAEAARALMLDPASVPARDLADRAGR